LRTIIRINKNVGIRRQALNAKQPVPKFQRTPAKRTKEKIQKVKRLATKENPMSYRGIKSQTSLSLGTIYNIIHVE
jgi:DNA invertase Pin-like site-specific DNA recombinase